MSHSLKRADLRYATCDKGNSNRSSRLNLGWSRILIGTQRIIYGYCLTIAGVLRVG